MSLVSLMPPPSLGPSVWIESLWLARQRFSSTRSAGGFTLATVKLGAAGFAEQRLAGVMVAESERGPTSPRDAFVGALAASFAERVRAHLTGPCDIVLTDEVEGMLEARAKLIAENIERAARGEPPLNRIPSPE